MTAAATYANDQAPVPRASTDSYEYDAYGNSFTVSGSTPNEMMYRGEQFDSDLGLYYLRARYYNPLTGRFMSRDPEDGKLTDPKSLHKYLYAEGDPIDAIDPTGRDTLFEGVWQIAKTIVKVEAVHNFATACTGAMLTSVAAFIEVGLHEHLSPLDDAGVASIWLACAATIPPYLALAGW